MASVNVRSTFEVSDELKGYVELKMSRFKRDNFVGIFTFSFAFRKFQRVWTHKYIKDKYNFSTKTIGLKGAKRIQVYKPNFRSVICKVAFNAALKDVLERANTLILFNPDYEYARVSDISKLMDLLESGTLEYTKPRLPKFHINPAIIEWRRQLPIWDHRVNIMEHIMSNQVTIISGEPGVGKSTQVPQYVLEYMASCAKESKTIIVVPHRIVAITMAKRVAFERGERIGGTVGYRVPTQFELYFDTSLIFCTNETMLRTLINGENYLATVTHVIVDNVDVRDKYTDLVLLCLRNCLTTYPKLKLILISASMNNQLFVDYFNGAPVVNIPSPNDNTCSIVEYYLDDLYKIIRRDPAPQDLVRLSPPCPLVKRFRESFNKVVRNDSIDLQLICELIFYICQNKPMGSILVYLPTYEEIRQLQQLIMSYGKLYKFKYDLYFLHRMVDTSNQQHIFQKNSSIRKIILATALAESSYFIDDIYYVIDIGKIRQTQFVAGTRLSNISISWISKAAAKRRSTRMGKNKDGPVECYHIYTRQEYKRMAPLDTAEILKAPITDLCLLSRKLAPHNLSLKEFFNRCIQPPAEAAIDCSIKYLKQIGAFKEDESITAWGNIMGQLPLEPRLTKMIMYALAFKCIEPIITVVAFISLRGHLPLPALLENQVNFANSLRRYSFDSNSDHLSLINLFAAWQSAKNDGKEEEFCSEHSLRGGIMDLVTFKRNQLLMHLYILNYLCDAPSLGLEEHNQQGNNWSVIKACLTAGLAPQFACVDSKNWSLDTELFNNLEIGNQSICYEKIRELPTDWLIYEASSPHSLIKNITCVNHITILLFATNCSYEIKDYDDTYKSDENMSLCLLNSWAQFSSKSSILKEIMRMRKKIEENIVFFITVPDFFRDSDAEKTFTIITNILKEEDRSSQVRFPINYGNKPALTRVRIDYTSQHFDLPECISTECPDQIYFSPVLSEYKRYIPSAQSENN